MYSVLIAKASRNVSNKTAQNLSVTRVSLLLTDTSLEVELD